MSAPLSPACTKPHTNELAHRPRDLAQLLGISDAEAQDLSLSARLGLIAKLQAARRAEITRGKTGSWLYDINRHLNLCSALRAEYEALSDFLAQNPQLPPQQISLQADGDEQPFILTNTAAHDLTADLRS